MRVDVEGDEEKIDSFRKMLYETLPEITTIHYEVDEVVGRVTLNIRFGAPVIGEHARLEAKAAAKIAGVIPVLMAY